MKKYVWIAIISGLSFWGCAEDSDSQVGSVVPAETNAIPAPPETASVFEPSDGTNEGTGPETENNEPPVEPSSPSEGSDSEATPEPVEPTPVEDAEARVADPVEPDAAPTPEEEVGNEESAPDTSVVDAGKVDMNDAADQSPEAVVRFVAFGDQGEGNDAQYAVGSSATKTCEEKGCDFALLLGDNFYDGGVKSVDDEQFATKFEQPYKDLDMPFYVVLGNHDYGETSFEWFRGEFQKQYSQVNPKWVLPKEYYTFTGMQGLADFFAFDTARIMWGDMVDEQKAFLNEAIANSSAQWKVAFAHHPYLSNGKHGNAGNYEGFSFIPIASGKNVEEFMDEVICGKVDLYLAGHDHNRQSFTASASNCGVHFIVNGASSKTTDFEYHDNNFTLWDDDQKEGYVWAEITESGISVVWYDLDGNVDFEYTIEK